MGLREWLRTVLSVEFTMPIGTWLVAALIAAALLFLAGWGLAYVLGEL